MMRGLGDHENVTPIFSEEGHATAEYGKGVTLLLHGKDRNRSVSIISASLILSLMLFSACSRSDQTDTLVIFAAGRARPAIDAICQGFEGQYRMPVETNYGGGGEILSKMMLAKSGDIYIAPGQLTGIGKIQIAVSAYTGAAKRARQFVHFTTFPEGKAIFKQCGYIVDAEEVKRYWQ
jgi:ABC-type molybdate transport system substrate-binding protein